MHRIGLIDKNDVRDATVIRVEKTYPAYFGSYERFPQLREWLDGWENLFLIGRNGMHKYNNQDHSMLTAMTAIDNILEGRVDKTNIWAVNTEQDYHEENAKK
jgi:protoporphyrinogen oxidase